MADKEFEKVLSYFEKEKKLPRGATSSDEPPNFPFTLRTEDFLKFAQADKEDNEKRGLINALSNIKRAIDCRTDQLLYVFGVYNLSKKRRWDFPTKMSFLEELGVIGKNLLININKNRNKLEHEFKKPTKREVEDYFGIAELFIKYTDRFVNKTYEEFELDGNHQYDRMPYSLFPILCFELHSLKGIFKVRYSDSPTENKEFKIPLEQENLYKRMLRIFVRCIQD
ncbi:MAG: hypothetical protein V1660_00040 [archaeon]